jgi:hypothetical protein
MKAYFLSQNKIFTLQEYSLKIDTIGMNLGEVFLELAHTSD